jgi:predicted GNAT family N-acyltransferase
MPIGTARTLNKENAVKIQRFAILKKDRKGGHGSFFIQEIERISQGQHFILSAQEHAIPFYEKNGYSIISEAYLEANIIHKDMEKRL